MDLQLIFYLVPLSNGDLGYKSNRPVWHMLCSNTVSTLYLYITYKLL